MITPVLSIIPESIRFKLTRRLTGTLADQRLVDLGMFPKMRACLETAKRNGLQPAAIVDVGAYEGEWTRLAREVFTAPPIHMVEANPQKAAALRTLGQSSNATLHPVLLGPEHKEGVEYFVMESGSSAMEELTDVARTKILLLMRPLDDVVSAAGPLLVKIDVQGFEIEVLRGATRVLSNTELIIIETSTLQYNLGAPLSNEVIEFLAQRGFVIYDTCGQFRRPDGTLFQLDLAFVKKDSVLRRPGRFWDNVGLHGSLASA